ncbi:hypothetical protein A2856_00265 [Candidatus Uhrbacteria bacterium RIFCSPHIGHO2_01_FULL_63_20]|uniref:Uncharacterized protein n=1 Tax=Candidatus Uhrbacteria bacterium RIFCSPHIGHO2_01_FULL_63_20 TaxID=1802385 RepID=A0A1F7TN25_9BACT|nr:MAG: hypothetical protein A2856_00265 [Candidatus Uhrbacteria bacterium RIFCSPHIGHO2_01_FULL_63_20]
MNTNFPKGWMRPEHLAEPARETQTAPKPTRVPRIKGKLLPFTIELLRFLNGYLLAKSLGVPVTSRALVSQFPSLDPEKVLVAVQAVIGLEIDVFSRHDFYNANVAARKDILSGAYDHEWFEVREVVTCFIPEEFSDEAKAIARSLLTRLVVAISQGIIRKSRLKP